MDVKGLVLASIWLACCAPALQASDHYRFRVAEGTQALEGQDLPSNMAELAGKPMMVLLAIDGTHWRWMLNGCAALPDCEWRIDDRGGQRVLPADAVVALARPWDIGLTRIDATRFRLRCFHESCVVHYGTGEAKTARTAELQRGASIELPIDDQIELDLTGDAKP